MQWTEWRSSWFENNLEDANGTIQALKWGRVQCRVSLVCDGEEAISFLSRKGVFARAPTRT